MDAILIIKSFFIGLVWAGSFYLVMSYILSLFPMPQLFNLRNRFQQNSDQLALHNEKKGLKRWIFFKGILKFITFLIWSGLLAAFAYLLIPVLTNYIPQENELFWAYYGIALAIPTLIILVQGIGIYRKAAKYTKPEEPEVDNRPLLEQMIG